MSYLQAELATARRRVSILHYRALERLGVSRDQSCEFWRTGGDFGVVNAMDEGRGLYVPGDGEARLVLPVYEDGVLVDLCAFRTSDPSAWLLRSGNGWALGLDRGLDRHSWHASAFLWEHPLDWLRSGCEGLVVLDWEAPEVRYLADLPHLVCSTPALAGLLRSVLSKPRRLPAISTMEGHALAA